MCRSLLRDPNNDKTLQSAQAAVPDSFGGLQLGSKELRGGVRGFGF